MNPEKEIISWWLHQQGYFTISSVKAPQNKEIDILAIKVKDRGVADVWHIECACSISSVDSMAPAEYKARFDDPVITRIVRETIKNYVGDHDAYQKVLVIGFTSNLGEFEALEGIKVLQLSSILEDVFVGLDKQNYRNSTIRTLQLLKYLTFSEPDKLARVLSVSSASRILKLGTRESFIASLLKDPENLRILAKPEFEDALVQILAKSSLRSPERLASTLHQKVLSRATRKRFLESIMGLSNIPVNEKFIEEIQVSKERPLRDFI